MLQNTQELVKKERELLSEVLHHLREIENRRLFSKLKYSSLFDYATKALGYSEDQAYRRIAAMRLLTEMPEIQEKINSGSLNLTHLGMAQSLFRREQKADSKSFTREEKLELLSKLQNTSKKEAEKVALTVSQAPLDPHERVRQVSQTQCEIRFVADQDLLDKLEKLRGLLAHTNPGMGLNELFKKLCELGLEKWDKSSPAPARVTGRQKPSPMATLRRAVWQKAQGQCEHCKSIYALEIHHVVPRAAGGQDHPDNMRLLCRSCNQRAAIEIFGLGKMDRFINKFKYEGGSIDQITKYKSVNCLAE